MYRKSSRCKPDCNCYRHFKRSPETIEKLKKKCEPGCTCGKHHGKEFMGPSYMTKHINVYKERGKAKYYECELRYENCSGQAAEWATKKNTSGESPEDYVAACVKCHDRYDGLAEQTRARFTGFKRSAKTREKDRQRNLGKKASDETRQKQSNAQKGKIVPINLDCSKCDAGPFSARGLSQHMKWKHPVDGIKPKLPVDSQETRQRKSRSQKLRRSTPAILIICECGKGPFKGKSGLMYHRNSKSHTFSNGKVVSV